MEEIVRNVIVRSFVASGCVSKLLRPASRHCQLQNMFVSSSRSAPLPSPTSSSRQPSSSVSVQRISDNLSFRPASQDHLDTTRRPIVLIYAWLAAKSRHIHKFGDFYLEKGYDVLHVKVGARQILWPLLAQSVASQILDFLTSPPRHSQPIIVHGFSVGGYLYGETLTRIMSNPHLTQSMSSRVRGQIFDSPVDFEGVPRGVGMALSDLMPVQVAIKSSLEAYMALFRHQVTKHYVLSSKTFYDNPLRTPSLLLYSKADVIGTPGPIEAVMGSWRKNGVSVSSRRWDNTPHVCHYLHDPVNYTAELNQFLANIGLLEMDSDDDQQRVAMPSSKL